MKTYRLIMFLLPIICFSCKEIKSSDDRTNTEGQVNSGKQEFDIGQIIENNKHNLLFMNFWAGMTNDEFLKVKEYENKSGNLENGKFLLFENEFEVLLSNNSEKIILAKDELLTFISEKNKIGVKLGIENYEEQYEEQVINEIIETLDKKYQRFDIESFIRSIEKKIDFPVKNKNSTVLSSYLIETVVSDDGHTIETEYSIKSEKYINGYFWIENTKVINLKYLIVLRDVPFAADTYLNISYFLLSDLKLDIEKRLIREKNRIEESEKKIERSIELL